MGQGSAHTGNYLDLVPRRTIQHEVGDDGRFVLLRPKYMTGLLARFLQPRLRAKHFRVQLDDIGTATWDAIDGARTVGQIADVLGEKFGARVEPRYERCARFIQSLHKGAMVTLAPLEGRAG